MAGGDADSKPMIGLLLNLIGDHERLARSEDGTIHALYVAGLSGTFPVSSISF